MQATWLAATDTLAFDGVGSNGSSSGAFSNVGTEGIGRGGSINLTANSLSLTNGAQVSAGVSSTTDTNPGGQGSGGSMVKLH